MKMKCPKCNNEFNLMTSRHIKPEDSFCSRLCLKNDIFGFCFRIYGSIILAIIALFLLTGCSGGNSSSGKQQRYEGSDEFISAMTQAESKYKAGRVAQINEGGTPYPASYDRTYNVIRFSSQWRQYENDDIAGILAHENTHASQPASKNHNHAVEKELAAFRVQVKFLQSIGRHDLAGKWAAMDGRHVCE